MYVCTCGREPECVCMYVHVDVSVCVFVYACIHSFIHTYAYTHTHRYCGREVMCVHVEHHVTACMEQRGISGWRELSARPAVCTCAQRRMCLYVQYAYVCICIYIYIYICMYVYGKIVCMYACIYGRERLFRVARAVGETCGMYMHSNMCACVYTLCILVYA